MEWQPIETLPNDPDMLVLVWADYIDEPKRWEVQDIWWINECDQYTHWMPLPAPPLTTPTDN